MFGLTRTIATEPDATTAHVELWTPAALAEAYGDVASSVREHTTPLTAPEWLRSLRGDDRMILGRYPADPDPMRGPLAAHLRAAIADRDHGGVIPGSLPDPRNTRSYLYGIRSGFEKKHFAALEPTQVGPTQQEAAEYASSVAAVPAFEAEVQQTLEAVLSDTQRAWNAFLHLATLTEARREIERRADEVKRERQIDLHLRCPVCENRNGSIASREVEPDYKLRGHSGGLRIRSCIPCWHEAQAQQQERRAAEHLASGQTRAERIAEWLEDPSA